MGEVRERETKVYLVTGSTGFVGLNLLEALVDAADQKKNEHNNIRILAVARPNSSRVEDVLYRYLPPRVTSRIEIVYADLNTPGNLAEALQNTTNTTPDVVETIDVIFHLMHARETIAHKGRVYVQPGFTPEGGAEHERLNLQAMQEVLTVGAANQVRRVIYCSSWSSYGIQPPGTFVDEVTTPSLAYKAIPLGLWSWFGNNNSQPIPYFVTKHKCERILQEAIASQQIRGGVILQPCSVFGPYSTAGWSMLFERFASPKQGGFPGLPGSSSFADARDLAQVFVAAATKGPGRGECYVIGGTNATNITMLQTIAKLVGASTDVSARPTPAWLLMWISRWNEFCLQVLAPGWLLSHVQIMPHKVGSPMLVAKLCQAQSATSARAKNVLGYQTRPFIDILKGNYDWLIKTGLLLQSQ